MFVLAAVQADPGMPARGRGLVSLPRAAGLARGVFRCADRTGPAVAGLLACRRRAGLVLGCAVLLSDAAGNGYACYAIRPGQGITVGQAGQAVVTMLAIALLAAAPRVWAQQRAWPTRPQGTRLVRRDLAAPAAPFAQTDEHLAHHNRQTVMPHRLRARGHHVE
jgi:hypothetical protein